MGKKRTRRQLVASFTPDTAGASTQRKHDGADADAVTALFTCTMNMKNNNVCNKTFTTKRGMTDDSTVCAMYVSR